MFTLALLGASPDAALASDVTLSQYSSDNTPASVLDARVQFGVSGSTLTVMVTNNTDHNTPEATYNINEVYFNASGDIDGLMVSTLPSPGWALQTNTSNVGSFGSFDFKLEGGNGANTPDKVAPGETKTFTFSIQGSGPFDANDFCMQVSDGSRPVVVACKFVNGEGDVVEDDDSAFGGGGMVNGDCMLSPTCEIEPSGPIKITLGQSAMFEVCGESMCDEDVTIVGVNPPIWCVLEDTDRSGSGECLSFSCTPPTPGMHTLTFRVTDIENGMETECSIMIEVNEPMGCQNLPLCTITPAGPLKITLGDAVDFEVCGQSLCDNFVDIDPVNPPVWCILNRSGGEEICDSYRCTPPTAGMHTLTFRVTDTINNQSSECSIMIEVNEPPCDDKPTCSITPPGPLKITVGEPVSFEVCGEGQCGNTVTISTPNGTPDWCALSNPFTISECRMYTCTPTINDVGMHTLEFQITDDVNAQSEFCSIMIEVNEPCLTPPICTITPEGPITAFVGEEFSFDVCGDSRCDGEVNITPLNLPDWCSDNGMRLDQECLTITCTPPNNVEGTHTFEFEVEDKGNGQKTTCTVDVEVVCNLEPMCFFTEDGPLTFAVGEEIDFEFCGATVCDGHRARIEMTSRPPFIDPAGHLKGGVDQEICLGITGTPRSGDIGSWRLLVTVTDLDTGIESECEIRIIVTGPPQCEDRPACSIEPGEDQTVGPGDSLTLTLCGESLCNDGTVLLEALDLPAFCGPFEPVVSEQGEEACAELLCVIPGDIEPGEYPVRFRVTDLENDRFRICETTIIVDEPEVPSFCVEEEPNDDFTTCTLLDANDCLDLGCGANVVGLLSLNGIDLDFYCLTGLEPFTEYLITVVGGLDCDGAPVCAALACLDDTGGIINSTNSGGVMMGYPSITCMSDANGFVQVAVSGCNDLDFDGKADQRGSEDDASDRGGIGHGSTGSYQVTVVPLTPTAAQLACHADMNGDGIVDTGDLGMLIGVFGELCAP